MSVEDGGAAGAAAEVAPTAFTDVMSATFQQAVADGVPPAEAFAQAEAACTEVAIEMGVPAADVAANLATAQTTFNDAVAGGTDPAAAMTSAAGQAATNMGMEPGIGGGDATSLISSAMGSAYEAAIQAGSSPADAFKAGKAAAENVAQEMGIDPNAAGPFLDTMTSVQATFVDAVQSGADPLAAMAGAQGMMDAGPALMGDPAIIATNPAFMGPLEAGFAGGMPEGFMPPMMAQGPDGSLMQPPVMGDALMMGPGGMPIINPTMMQPGAMQMGPNGEIQASDPNFFPPPPFGDPAFMPPTPGMPGFEAFSSAATQVGLNPEECCVPGFMPPPGTPGMDQPGMPSAPIFDPAGGAFGPPPPYAPNFGPPPDGPPPTVGDFPGATADMYGMVNIPGVGTFAPDALPDPSVVANFGPPPADFFQAPPANFFDPGALPPVGGSELVIGSFAGPGAPMVSGPDGMLIQDPSYAPPPMSGMMPGPDGAMMADPAYIPPPMPGSDGPASPMDQAFQPGPDTGPGPMPFDPVADAVGGATDAAAPQGPSPVPDPATAPIAPDPGPAAPDPVADAPPPPDEPVGG